jgi:methionyl aminopeptidase
MITLGKPSIETAKDGWAILTRDRSVSAHSEHTIIITEGEPLVVTRRPSELKK